MTDSRRSPDHEESLGPAQGNRNVVIVLLDDGGAEWFSWSGLREPASGFARTPNLDALRQLGVTFTRAYAAPICAPSRARLWSGSYAFDLGLGGNPASGEDYAFCGGGASIADWKNPPPITAKLLPRLLAVGKDGTDALPPDRRTYTVASFGKSHLHADEDRETWPVDHGLEWYAGMQPNAGKQPSSAPNKGHFHFREVRHAAGEAPVASIFGASGTWPAGGPYAAFDAALRPPAAWDAYLVMRRALEWMNASTRPFVAFVNFNPPHAPFESPPVDAPDDVGHGATGGRFRLIAPRTEQELAEVSGGAGTGWPVPRITPVGDNRARLAVYRANLEAVDALIGKLWERLEPARRARTVFVLVGDNGTVSNCVDAPYDPTRAKRTPYEMGARVPCLVWGAADAIVAPGRTCHHLVHLVDVLPTVLDLARCDATLWNSPRTRVVRGRSFAGALLDPAAAPARDHVYNEIFLPLDGTRDGAVPIDPATWLRTYGDGEYQLIRRPNGAFELYRIDAANQPASGEPGYLQRPVDDLFPLVGTPGNEEITARFDALVTAMEELVES